MIANVNLAHFTDRRELFTNCITLSSVRTVLTDRKTVNTHSCHENILSPTNEMRFTDRKTHFTDRIPLLSICSIRTDRQTRQTDKQTDKPYITTLAMKIFLVALIRCDLQTVKNLYRPYTPFVDPFDPYRSTNGI